MTERDRPLRVGWLADKIEDVIGGAELCEKHLRGSRPRRIEVVACPPGKIAEDVDVYAIHNCTQYRIADVVPKIRAKPVVKVVYEQWFHGEVALRQWLLTNSNLLLFLGQPHVDDFPHEFRAPHDLMPTIVNLDAFRAAAIWGNTYGRQGGVMWMAQMTGEHKGLKEAIAWAEANETKVDFYGGGPIRFRPHNFTMRSDLISDMGQVPYGEVPRTMAMYQKFLFLPTILDTCSRTIFEASAAGLDLITNENCGATWWLENRPEDIEKGNDMFWAHVLRVADEKPLGLVDD